MFALRCTQKLLDRLKAAPDPAPAQPDTVLGHWYAQRVEAGRTQVVLAVSERSLLPVVLPAAPGKTLVPRLIDALAPILLSVGVPADAAAAECAAMQQWTYAKTASRPILGSLNDLTFQLQVALRDGPDQSPLALALWLARTPLSVIEYSSPDRATVAAFEARRVIRGMVGR